MRWRALHDPGSSMACISTANHRANVWADGGMVAPHRFHRPAPSLCSRIHRLCCVACDLCQKLEQRWILRGGGGSEGPGKGKPGKKLRTRSENRDEEYRGGLHCSSDESSRR
eukprot:481687-Rhodomonas_salina.1